MILENGWSDDGRTLNDWGRIEYLRGHLRATLEAIGDGCRVLAHTTWSLMDNFEWTAGYAQRFGLYHVDFTAAGRTRRAKRSVGWLRRVIETREVP